MIGLRRFARNVSMIAVAQAVTWTATFLFIVAQARYLGPARFGELSLALSYAALLGVVVDFGLSTKLARDVAQRPTSAGHALAATLVVRLGLWCVAMPLVWLSTLIFGYGAELQASVLILGGSLLVGGVAASLAAYFQGREEFLFPSLGSIAQRGSAAVLGIGALALGEGVVVVASVYVASTVLQVLVLAAGMRRHPVAYISPDRATAIGMFRGAAVLGCFWILGAFYYNVDMLILQRLAPIENVAWYAAAYRLFNVALMAVGLVLGTVLYPVLSRLSVGPRDELRRVMGRLFVFLLVSGVFIALTLAVTAERVVALVYPERDYGEAAAALRLLAPGLAAIYANGVFFLALLGMGFERRLLVMAAVLAVLNPLANLLFIPTFQQNAAALITSATEVAVLIWVLALTPADLRRVASPAVVLKTAVAALPAAACLWLMRDQSIFVSVPLAGTAFAIGLLGLGVIPRSELRALRFAYRGKSGAARLGAGHVVAPTTVEP